MRSFRGHLDKKIFISVVLGMLIMFSAVPAAASTDFTDVSDRYVEAVDYLASNGLADGINDTQFGVSKQIKRGDAAIILAKALDLPIEDAPASGFTDVPARGVKAINALKHAGVVNGKSASNFGFNDPLKRGEIALMLTKASAYDLQGKTNHLTFTDVNSRYKEAVSALVVHKVTSGKTTSRFGTDDLITRGEYAIFIYRAEMLGQSPVPLEVGVATDKVWEFPFDSQLEEASLTKEAIYVLDQNNNKVDITISTNNHGQTLVISPPPGGYKKGSAYELHITKDIKYTNGERINKLIRWDFIISDSLAFDLEGEWNRNILHYEGKLSISNVSSTEFDFALNVASGGNTGDIEGRAKISGNTALFEMEDSTCEVSFSLTADVITVSVTDECSGWGGLGTFFYGEYEKGEPAIDTDLVKQGILSEKQNSLFKSVVGESYGLFVTNMNLYYEGEDLDGLQTTVVSGFVRGMAPYMNAIIMINNQYVYAAVPDTETSELLYYTNDPKYKGKLPLTIQEWNKNLPPREVIYK